jgi:hypothetical protein
MLRATTVIATSFIFRVIDDFFYYVFTVACSIARKPWPRHTTIVAFFADKECDTISIVIDFVPPLVR